MPLGRRASVLAVLILLPGCSVAGTPEDSNNAVIVFSEQDLPPERPSSLNDTSWRLLAFQGMGDGVGWIPPAAGEVHAVTFRADGTAELQLGCHRGTGRWAASEREAGRGSVEIDPPAGARSTCAGARMRRIAADLESVVSYVIDEDGRLHLNLAADSGNLVWARVR